jgi:cell division transport system ATP-binding protein
MIDFSHVYKTYPGPVHALRDINLKVDKGEFVFLTGPSGAGKTTLFRLMSAYDRSSSGKLLVSGQDVNSLENDKIPYFRRRIGVVYQDFRLLKDRSIFENVALPLEILGQRQNYILSRVNEMLSQVGLLQKKYSYPSQLSGGEQQRVAIARALVHHPGLLIADEPTGNLDPQLGDEIIDLFLQANAQGTTVFVATHDLELVKRRGRRVLRIENGQVATDK